VKYLTDQLNDSFVSASLLQHFLLIMLDFINLRPGFCRDEIDVRDPLFRQSDKLMLNEVSLKNTAVCPADESEVAGIRPKGA
jgi:hypothetical protein